MRLLVPVAVIAALGYFGWHRFHDDGNAAHRYVSSASEMAAYAKWSLSRDPERTLVPTPKAVECSELAEYRERTGGSLTYYGCDVSYAVGPSAEQCWVTIEPLPAERYSNAGQFPHDPGCADAMLHDPGVRAG